MRVSKVRVAATENENIVKLLGVYGRVANSYQSQVIPTAVQCGDHHLLINYPNWVQQTKKTVLNDLSILMQLKKIIMK